MGRKRVHLTEEEKAERKARYFGDTRNARRRKLYHESEEYRSRVNTGVKQNYRKRRAQEGQSVRSDDCRQNIPLLGQIGQVRSVEICPGQDAFVLCLTLPELAKAVGRDVQVLYRWTMRDRFPAPAFRIAIRNNVPQGVFLEAEAAAILEVMGAHMASSQYYKTEHTETRDLMFSRLAEVRSRLGVKDRVGNNDDTTTHAPTPRRHRSRKPGTDQADIPAATSADIPALAA